MQAKLVELANDTVAVNAKLINKSVDYNVKTAKEVLKNATAHAGEVLKVKNLNDYAAIQGKMVQYTIEQTNDFARTCIELGLEAKDAYTALWQDYAVVQNPLNVAPSKN